MESAFDLLPPPVWIGLIVIFFVGIIVLFFINRSRNKEVDDLQNAFNQPYHMTVDDEEEGMEEEVQEADRTSEPTEQGSSETDTSERREEIPSRTRSRFRRNKGQPANDEEEVHDPHKNREPTETSEPGILEEKQEQQPFRTRSRFRRGKGSPANDKEKIHDPYGSHEPTEFTESDTSEKKQEIPSRIRSRFRRSKGDTTDQE